MSKVAWDQVLEMTDRGHPHSTLTNAVRALQYDPMLGPTHLWSDEFLDRIFYANSPVREWTEEDDYRLTVHIQETTGMTTIGDQIVSKAVRMVAKQRVRHVVRDWLSALEWDQEPRIEMAFEDHWGVVASESMPADYIRAASTNFFLGMVARIFQPGCQLDTMVVFEGPQGAGKTSALRELGGEWYGLAHESVQKKDFFESLKGKWLIEIGELDAFSRAEVTRVKTAISTPVDRYRKSYGRLSVDHPRQCVFAGTTNKDDWGNDETGLRRFWPMRCGEINVRAISDSRNQLFAEAVAKFRLGDLWWKMPQGSTENVQADRQSHHPWTEAVKLFVLLRDTVRPEEILTDCIKRELEDQDDKDLKIVCKILRLAGWENIRARSEGKMLRVWRKPMIEAENETKSDIF